MNINVYKNELMFVVGNYYSAERMLSGLSPVDPGAIERLIKDLRLQEPVFISIGEKNEHGFIEVSSLDPETVVIVINAVHEFMEWLWAIK